MSLEKNFYVASTALAAQMVRLNTVATNIANAGVVAGTEPDAFRAKRPVFESILSDAVQAYGSDYEGGVIVSDVVEDQSPVKKIHQPWNEIADEDGYVYASNVNEVEEMVEMLSAARSYENNVQVIATSKELTLRTLDLTKA